MNRQQSSLLAESSYAITSDAQTMILEALRSSRRVEGLTHNFYRYPARFAPEFVQEIIQNFTREGDWILDPFMGGGTSIVEAVANGRKAIGIDINPLAHFISTVKTTPQSKRDQDTIRYWVSQLKMEQTPLNGVDDSRLKNMPEDVSHPLSKAIESLDLLPYPRQQRFARCALLKLGQWAIEVRKDTPSPNHMKEQLSIQIEEMLAGLAQFVEAASKSEVPKNKITNHRVLHMGTLNNAMKYKRISKLSRAPKLVITSPPYPGVHVLYHRWQVNGRRETQMPYFLAGLQDGHGVTHYTMGGRRSAKSRRIYFEKLVDIFTHLHQFIDPNALVVQLVAFSNPDTQLPEYIDAMHLAGYEELTPFDTVEYKRPCREVPNRKWYTTACKGRDLNAGTEVLLFHKSSQ